MFELCLLWLLLFLPAQGFLVWFPGASLLLLLRFRPTNHSKTQKFLSHCVPPPAPARSLPLIGQPRGAVRRAAAELHRFCAFDCFRLVVCCGHHLAMSGMSLMPLHFKRGSVASAVCHLCPSPLWLLPQRSAVRSHRVALAALLVAASCPCTSLNFPFPSSSSIFWISCRWVPRLALLLLLTF